MDKPRTKKFRTETLLANLRGEPGEWEKLFGIVMLTDGWNYRDSRRFNQLVDTIKIATRIDELRAPMVEAIRKASADLEATLAD